MAHSVRSIVGCVMVLLAVNAAGAGDASPLSATLRVLVPSPVDGPVATRVDSKPEGSRVVSDLPQVRVSTAGPESLVLNEPAKYVISLDNLGVNVASKINVRCVLPAWVELGEHVASTGKLVGTHPDVVWQVDTIAGRAHQELSLNLVPREGKAFELKVDISVEPSNVNKKIAVRQPKLDLVLAGPAAVSYGKSSVWKLNVLNPGTGELKDVEVDVFAGDSKVASQMLPRLSAGGEQAIDLEINPTEVGSHSIRVVAKSGKLSDVADASFVVRRGRLAVNLNGVRRDFAGATSQYAVKVLNEGDDEIQNVLLTLDLPTDMEYVSGIEKPSLRGSGISWVVNRVAVGEQLEFPLMLAVKKGGQHELQVTASTMDRMSATDRFSVEAITAPDIKLEVTDPVGPRRIDSVAEYAIRILNHGTDTARDISVIAVCDSNLEPVDVSGNAALRDGKVYFKPVETLEPNHKITFKVLAKAKKSGSHDFRVIVKSVVPETRLAVQETTRFFDMNQAESQEPGQGNGDDKVAAGSDNPRSSLLQPLSFEPQFRAAELPTKTRR